MEASQGQKGSEGLRLGQAPLLGQALGLQARDHQDQDRQEEKCKSHISQKLNTFVGSRNCDYTCERNRGCKVTYVGPPRAGRTQVKHASTKFWVNPQFQYRQ